MSGKPAGESIHCVSFLYDMMNYFKAKRLEGKIREGRWPQESSVKRVKCLFFFS